MDNSKYRLVTDFGNLLMRLNNEIPSIGFNDEGRAEALFIQTRELIKKHFGEEHGYYKDYLRVRSLKGAYTFQLKALVPVVELIANNAKSDYLEETEKFQQEIMQDSNSAKGSGKIPWKELDKLERKFRPKEPLSVRIKRLFQVRHIIYVDSHRLKVIFLIVLGIGLCSVPFLIEAVPNWLGYVSGIVVAVVGTLFTMNRK